MVGIVFDFETRSTVDLKKDGLYKYARHPDTDVICLSWALGDEEPHLWHPGLGAEILEPLFAHVRAGGLLFAHNITFDLNVWNQVCVRRYGFPPLALSQCRCTMAMAYAMGLPGALEDVALALGLHVQKDMEGRALVLRVCRPRSRPGITPIVWWDEPAKLERVYEYCRTDVKVEYAVKERLMPLSAKEQRLWELDARINLRGVHVDRASVQAAQDMAEVIKNECNLELDIITGGKATTITALIPLKEWLADQGVNVESLAKRDLADWLDALEDRPELATARRALELRQEGGKASTAKLDRILGSLGPDDRLRNLYAYHGAASGRWAGRGVQVHNLPRDMRKPHEVDQILRMVRAGDHRSIDAIFGPPLTEISRALRSFFCAPPGRVLVGGDWSNVEGRGQAWFAGEQWKVDAFVAADEKRGPGLYELAYSRMFNVPVESVKNPSEERQVGKVAELAFGYAGGVGSFHTMGKNYNVTVSDAKADEFKVAWRAAHPMIVKTWYEIENAAKAATRNPGEAYTCGFPGRQATFKRVGSFLWLLLPSGRVQCFPYPKILEGAYGPQLTYMTVPSDEDRRKGKIIQCPENAANWARVATYGGALFNRIVQGFCRDFLADFLLEADDRGAEIVLHTHDDANIEVDAAKAEAARKLMQKLMNTPPAWAAGFPLKADVHIMDRYGK